MVIKKIIKTTSLFLPSLEKRSGARCQNNGRKLLVPKGGLLALGCLFFVSCTGNAGPITPGPSTSATSLPSAAPTPSASAVIPSQSATPGATPTPSAVTTDISSFATLNGKIFDNGGNLLSDVQIIIRSLDKKIDFLSETKTSQGGSFVFQNVPAGVPMEVKAFKSSGWTTKTQTVVIKANITGDPNANLLDFGDGFSIDDPLKTNFYFLSNAPEVIAITPAKNSSLKHYGLSFKLTFSELVKKKSVEDNIILRYVKENISPLTVVGDYTDGPPSVNGLNQVFFNKDTSGGIFQWDTAPSSQEGKEVIFTLDKSIGLPTRPDNSVYYALSLRGKENSPRIADAENINGLDRGEFFINNVRSRNILFNILPDKTEPILKEVKIYKTSTKRRIRVVFSEPMDVQGSSNTELLDIANYIFYRKVSNEVITLNNPEISYSAPDTVDILCDLNSFSDGDTIKIEVNLAIKDPAGNFMSQGQLNGDPDNIKSGNLSDTQGS